MEGYEEVIIDGHKFWIVWNQTDYTGYDHRIGLRSRDGNYVWSIEMNSPQSIVNKRVDGMVVKIWTGDGDLIDIDIRTGEVLRTTFVK